MSSDALSGGNGGGRPFDPREWLCRLRERVEAAGGAAVIHVVEGEAPRIRREPGRDLEPLEGAVPLGTDQVQTVIDFILQDGGEQALEQTGEAQRPLLEWRDARGQWWVAQVFKADRGGRRLLIRRYASADEWLMD